MKHLHSSHETGLIVRCHFDVSPKRWWQWQHKKASRNCWLAWLFNCGGIYCFCTHWRMCVRSKGTGLVHSWSSCSSFMAVPLLEKLQFRGMMPKDSTFSCHVTIFYSTLVSSTFIRQYLKLAAFWIALCSVVCEMPDLRSLSSVRSTFVSAIVNLSNLECHFSATIQPFWTIEVCFSMFLGL